MGLLMRFVGRGSWGSLYAVIYAGEGVLMDLDEGRW